MDAGNLEGLIPLIGGSYALLAVHGKIKVKNKEFVETHRKLMLVCGYGCVVFGLLLLAGVFSAGR